MKDIQYHLKGFQYLIQQLSKGKYLWYFVPGLVITVLYWFLVDRTSGVGGTNFTSSWLVWDWILKGVNWLTSGTTYVLGMIGEQIYIFAVLTLISPFNTSLAEKVDEDLTGHKVDSSLLLFINDMIRMIFVVILMLAMELILMGVYWIFSWVIPDFIDKIVYFIIASFFFGLSYYDFALERYKQNVFATIGYGFKKPLGMIITGGVFLAIYEIPYVGIPISPVVAVVISTVAYAYYNNYVKDKNEVKAIENE